MNERIVYVPMSEKEALEHLAGRFPRGAAIKPESDMLQGDDLGHIPGDDEPEAAPPEPEETGGEDVLRDSSGMPWDARIHSSGKTLLKSGKRNGLWRYKGGVDESVIAAVEAELNTASATAVVETQLSATAEPTVAPPAMPTPPAPVTMPPAAGGAPVAPAPVTTPAPEVTAPACQAFAGLMNYFTEHQAAGKITPEEANQITASEGAANAMPHVNALGYLATAEHLVPAVLSQIQAICQSR